MGRWGAAGGDWEPLGEVGSRWGRRGTLGRIGGGWGSSQGLLEGRACSLLDTHFFRGSEHNTRLHYPLIFTDEIHSVFFIHQISKIHS